MRDPRRWHYFCPAPLELRAGERWLSRHATSDIPTSLHFFWTRETNIRDIVTKTIRIKAEEPHKPVAMLIFSRSHLDPTLWQVENNECSLSGCQWRQCADALNRNHSVLETGPCTLPSDIRQTRARRKKKLTPPPPFSWSLYRLIFWWNKSVHI